MFREGQLFYKHVFDSTLNKIKKKAFQKYHCDIVGIL